MARFLLNKGAKTLSKKTGNISKMSMLGVAINGGFAISDYNNARKNGSSTLGAAASAAGMFVTGEVLGAWMLPAMLAKGAPGAMVNAAEGVGKIQRQMDMQSRPIPFSGANFNNHQQAYTMRQAGMQIAQQSQYNLQQALLGQEATHLR